MIDVPILNEVDVLFVGGDVDAVIAASTLAQRGRRAMLTTRLSFLGDSLTASLALDRGMLPRLAADLGRPAAEGETTPMAVKRLLEQHAIEAGVELLYVAYPIAPLLADDGAVAGMVLATRSGLVGVRATSVVDGGELERPSAPTELILRTLDPRVADSPAISGHRTIGSLLFEGAEIPVQEYSFALSGSTPGDLLDAEGVAREAVWTPETIIFADAPMLVDAATATRAPRPNVDEIDARIAGAPGSPRLAADQRAAAGEAGLLAPGGGGPTNGGAADRAQIVRRDRYFRALDCEIVTVAPEEYATTVTTDVYIAGGGTGGAPAAIAVGREGRRALLVEYLPGLGGVGTEGRIASYYFGNRVGFTEEIDAGLPQMGEGYPFEAFEGRWIPEWKGAWYLREVRRAGARPWFGSLNAAARCEGNRVCGALVATPYGPVVVESTMAIDCTGNGDLAAAAGAETTTVSHAHVAFQGTGLPFRTPGTHATNTDYFFVDDSDALDVTRAYVTARGLFGDKFDLARMIDSRERRQIVGEVALDPVDFLTERTFPDTVVITESNFDTHGFTIHPVFLVQPPDHDLLRANVPLRAFIPRGLEGVLVTGLAVGAHRDALPVIRMQPDVQNQGYAAGLATVQAIESEMPIREIDVRALQRKLVELGALPPEVVAQEDSHPIPESRIVWAATAVRSFLVAIATLFSDPARAVPALERGLARARKVLASNPNETWQRPYSLRAAMILALLGNPSGIDLLVEEIEGSEWDEGWNYKGMGQFGASMSPMDRLIVAAATSGSSEVVPAILDKLRALDATSDFSHLRACTLAFERQPTPEAAPQFERILSGWPELGRVGGSLSDSLRDLPTHSTDNEQRNEQLKRLMVARGLLACGDPNGEAVRVLEEYAKSMHGVYARHAAALKSHAGLAKTRA
ncbi:MAG: FAD-dependent oxidoreductase [Spirochaetota bacterium]